MTTQPEALRLADLLEQIDGQHWQVQDSAAAELRRLHAECNDLAHQLNESNERNGRIIAQRDALLEALKNLRRAAYWIVEGGEFAYWVNDKLMPMTAAKELDELAEMMQAAQAAIAKTEENT